MSMPNYNLGLGYAGAGMGGLLSSFMSNPDAMTDAASPYMNDASNDIQNYYNKSIGYQMPFYNGGVGALSSYGNMVNQEANPNFYNNLMNGFQMTPAQQQQQKLGLEGVSNNASMNGLMGSGNEAKNLETYASQNTAQAQQLYLQNRMNMFKGALSGYGNIMNQGFNAASNMGNYGMSAGQSLAEQQEAMANLAANQANSNQQGWGGALASLGAGLGDL